MTNLTIKFGELSLNISKLLNIFEESAKALAKSEKQVDGQVINKIDSLLEQNKTIAKGLVLFEDQFKRQSRFTSPATNLIHLKARNKIHKQDQFHLNK